MSERKKKKIFLLTSDSDMESRLLAWCDASAPYEILSTPSFHHFLDGARKIDACLFVMDLDEFQENATEMVRIAQMAFPAMPVVLIASRQNTMSAIEMLQKGVFYTLTKPLNLSEFDIAVQSACET